MVQTIQYDLLLRKKVNKTNHYEIEYKKRNNDAF